MENKIKSWFENQERNEQTTEMDVHVRTESRGEEAGLLAIASIAALMIVSCVSLLILNLSS